MNDPGKISYNADHPQTLNVLFHGLWAYEVNKDEIVVRTPPEPDHRVAAGSWIPERNLREGATYRLEGVVPGDAAEFDRKTNAVFDNKKLVEGAEVYCTIRLPLPKRISSLRPIMFNKDKSPYTGANADEVKTRKISIIQVFTYEANLPQVRLLEDAQPAKAAPSEIPLPRANKSDVANFYLFAQPDDRVGGSHFEEAFSKLAALYGLDLVPVPSIAPGPRTPDGLTGVIWRDLVGLNERANSRSELIPAAGSSGSNCDPFIVDNRNPVGSDADPSQSPAQHLTYSEPVRCQ